MNMQMKRMVLAAVMAGLSAPALSVPTLPSAFSDRTTAKTSLEFARDTNKITLTLQQLSDVYAGVVLDAGTAIATLSASSERPAKLGLRWSPVGQTVNGNQVTVTNKTQTDKTVTLEFATAGLTETVLGTETYYVSGAAGQVNNSITLVNNQEIEPGQYPVTVSAAVYNE